MKEREEGRKEERKKKKERKGTLAHACNLS
jgi:hypothetical protein